VTEKNNSRVDVRKPTKKTVQAQRYEGRGFLAAGDCLAELPVINLQAKPDRFFYFTLHDLLLLDPVYVQTLQYLIYFV